MEKSKAIKRLGAEMDRMTREYFTPGYEELNKKHPGQIHIIRPVPQSLN